MNLIAVSTLRSFWERHPQSENGLRLLARMIQSGRWEGPQDFKSAFGRNVDFVAGNRVIIDVGGNKYRVVLAVSYSTSRAFVKFVGTHAEYDRIDAGSV
ncbi:MAG: type II toxin-antitoxin system HigB family toxin [Rhizobiaceae bacterium]